MVAFTTLLAATAGMLAATTSAAPAPARGVAAAANASIEERDFEAVFRELLKLVQENPGAYVFAAERWDTPGFWEEGLAGFGGGNGCARHPWAFEKLPSGQDRPTKAAWVCWGGGWFPRYQEAQDQGLYHVCPTGVACGMNDGGLWGN